MIHELVVTSVPRGLQAGRSGFTTVLRTRGIHPQLAETLERASGYRHVFPHGDPRNPQIRSHTVVTGATGVVSVLSRIVDAGSDYSGRSNKLAHHVALDSGETAARSKSNPAAVLLALERSGAFQRQWSGDPREQPTAPQVPVVASEPGPCQAWGRLAGDAGWAGLIVDRALAKQPTWIIAPQGLDLLELFAEALGLVNYPQRWGVTFTTYALSAGDGLWLGTADGSPEAQAARGQSRLAVVDLVRRAPLTSTSPAIDAARGTALVPWRREPVRPAAAVAVAAPLPVTGSGGIAAAVPAAGVSRGGTAMPPSYVPGGPPVLNGAPPPLAPGGPLGAPAAGDNLLLPAGMAGPARRQRSIGGFLAGLAAMLLIGVIGGVVVVVNPNLLQRSQDPANEEVAVVTTPRPNTAGGKTVKSDPLSDKVDKSATKVDEPPTVLDPAELAAKKEQEKEEAARLEAEAKKAARSQAFRDLKARLEEDRHLPLKAAVDLERQEEQTLELCELRSAEVGVDMPELVFKNSKDLADTTEWRLVCEESSAGPWGISLYAGYGPQYQRPVEDFAKVSVTEEGDQRMLSLTLLEMPTEHDPVWLAGREALTTAVVVLRLPGSQPSADTETFVQLCTPKRFDPLRFKGLLTDSRKGSSGKRQQWLIGTKPGDPLEAYAIPDTPWPCLVELEGRAPGGVTAVVTATASGPRKIAAQSQLEPLEVTARWVWSGEQEKPFMETTLALQNRSLAPGLGSSPALEVQMTGSKVLPPWDGWRRLGDLEDSERDREQENRDRTANKKPPSRKFLPSPVPAFFEQQLPEPSDADGKSQALYPLGMLKSYARIAIQYRKALNPQVLDILAQGEAQSVRKPMGEWQQSMRDVLKASPGYQAWANKQAPDPGPKPGDKDPRLAKWQADKQDHDRYAAAGPEVAREFWDALKADKARHGPESAELILCCLHFELEPVLKEKRLTKRLLEAVGDGTVEFTGKVWAEVKSDPYKADSTSYKVLLAEFDSPALRATDDPFPTPPPRNR
jgi:hypothetical protein